MMFVAIEILHSEDSRTTQLYSQPNDTLLNTLLDSTLYSKLVND